MLASLGFAMVVVFMALIMTRRLSPMVALILVPVLFAVLGGFTQSMGVMMLEGVRTLAPTGIMLMFAILYFGVMNDAGLFDPLAKTILRLAKGDPVKILVGTAIFALLVSLDGDGSTTYIVVLSAMIPLYQKLRLNPLFLSAIVMLAVGVTNTVPWGGPTARAASALHLDPAELFMPMLPALLGCACWVIFCAAMLGFWERKRLGMLPSLEIQTDIPPTLTLPREGGGDFESSKRDFEPSKTENQFEAAISLKRDEYQFDAGTEYQLDQVAPKNFIWNLLLTLLLIVLLMLGSLPMPILFMLGLAMALMINYPRLEDQKTRLAAHAPSVMFVVSLIFAAGLFTGILSGTHMVDAMTASILAVISKNTGPHLSIITALISMPMTFLISNDTFYYGMLPILSRAAANYGISAAEIGRASIIGQPIHLLSPLVPSTYLLVNMAQVDFSAHQRFTMGWAVISCLVMLTLGLMTGVIPV
jgi:CitMHS family citrate-Mg2+:H+ or citrate-Ca2+:H+ symporter